MSSVPSVTDARSFLDAVAGYSNPSSSDAPPASYDRPVKLATVDAGYTGGTARVLFDGESTIGGRGYAWDGKGGYSPTAGERVFLIPVGQSYIIGGPIVSTIPYLKQIEMPYISPLTQFDPFYHEPAITKSLIGIVILRGMFRVPTAGFASGSLIMQLPAGFRPDATLRLPITKSPSGAAHAAVNISTGGAVTLSGVVEAGGWFSLGGVTFPAAGAATWTAVGAFGATGPELARFAQNYRSDTANGYGPVSYWKDPYGFVWWKGAAQTLVAQSVDNTPAIILSAGLKPLLQQHWVSTAGTSFSYFGSGPNANICWKSQSVGTANSSISVAAVVYATSNTNLVLISAFQNSWTNFGADFTQAGFHDRPDGLVILQGLIKAPGLKAVALKLPSGSRLKVVDIIASVSAEQPGRFDLDGAGDLAPIESSSVWFSLDGRTFAAEQ